MQRRPLQAVFLFDSRGLLFDDNLSAGLFELFLGVHGSFLAHRGQGIFEPAVSARVFASPRPRLVSWREPDGQCDLLLAPGAR